ncbi:hypothetical protein HHI36_009548 [Cryptolaemus montrouzieri]|uniref:Uncharacterized protein n=1 Tax=Cryptolaemus montrouzieri TaxID=559131 RepID=A0ABD2MG54_9CUCU
MNTRIDVLDSQYSSRKSVIDNAIRPKKIANVNQIPPDRLNEMIADHLLRQDNVKRGLQYYNQALAMNPQDPKLLQKRSDANRKYFRMEAGMADVQRSLKINPDDLSGINRLLKFLYLNGEFEKSLLLNMKYSKIRKQPPHFTDGVLECTRAIKVCVGKNAGHPLRDHFEIIRELAWKKNMSMQKGHPKRRKKRKKKKPTVATSTAHVFESVKPPKILRPYEPPGLDDEDSEDEQDIATDSIKPIVCMKKIAGFSNKVTKIHDVPMFRSSSRMSLRKRVSTTESRAESYQSLATVSLDSSLGGSLEYSEPPIHIPKVYMYMYHPLQRRTANIENYMSSMYLGELLQEKKFFTTLLERPGCSGYNVNANERIDDASKDGLHILYTAQEILRTRKPFYYIKYQELMTKSKKLKWII